MSSQIDKSEDEHKRTQSESKKHAAMLLSLAAAYFQKADEADDSARMLEQLTLLTADDQDWYNHVRAIASTGTELALRGRSGQDESGMKKQCVEMAQTHVRRVNAILQQLPDDAAVKLEEGLKKYIARSAESPAGEASTRS